MRKWIFGPSDRYAPDRYIFVLTDSDDGIDVDDSDDLEEIDDEDDAEIEEEEEDDDDDVIDLDGKYGVLSNTTYHPLTLHSNIITRIFTFTISYRYDDVRSW